MSYILDALKKSQAEQTGDGVALRVQQTSARRSLTAWLIGAAALVLVLNAVLLLWLFEWRDAPVEVSDAAVAAQPRQTDPAAGIGPASTTVNPPQSGIPAQVPASAPPGVSAPQSAAAAPERQAAPAQPTAAARTAAAAPARVTRPSGAASVPRVLLSELSPVEQTLYNGFNYSTHIYTDDPTLCAIVVDGERLVAGDAFKGLKVVAITENGVVFEENRRGRRREVEVSVLEQWDS